MKRIICSLLFVLCFWGISDARGYKVEMIGEPVAPAHRKTEAQRIQKRYNIFFRINSPKIDTTFQDNARTLKRMKADIDSTLAHDGAIPDSLLILSTASPDGSYAFNQKLARARSESTEALLLEMFPQFADATILVNFLEEDWDGLKQVLKTHPEFPDRDKMLAIIDGRQDVADKEAALRACKKGWEYLKNNYIHALRNSSITISVIGAPDEYTRLEPLPVLPGIYYKPYFTAPETGIVAPEPIIPEFPMPEPEYKKMIFAPRTNLLIPALNVGLEVPIKDNWSVGIDYLYPWAVSKHNKWCGEMLGLFVDAKYWFPGEKYQWTDTERLQGHAVGVYAGAGYYDYQNISRGAQGEYIDFGVDYTFALPIYEGKLRLEFNLGVGLIRTWYRSYKPSTDFEDLIRDPGIKYRATNFIGPTRAGVSLVVPVIVKTKGPRGNRNGGNK